MTKDNDLQTKRLAPTPAAIAEAAAVLKRGGLVAFPTETVYGLGADAENPAAVRAMFAAKGRPSDHPVIVHLAAADQLSEFVARLPEEGQTLARTFWPGPMTLVLNRGTRINHMVTGGLETVGIRIPNHPVAQALLRAFGGALAAPSANRFGRVSATQADHVLEELTGGVEIVLDGGDCDVGLESTIIDLSSDEPAILRPGAVTREQVEAALARPLAEPRHSPRVSGSLPSHYAPRAIVELVPANELADRAQALANNAQRVAVLTSYELPKHPNVVAISLPDNDNELARVLYASLRRVDALHCDVALVCLPDERGLGRAIADRLRRAAGPR